MTQMQIHDIVAWTWILLALASTAYVGWDQFRHNPEATVMKWGWVLVTLYLGPVALLLYVMSDKEPAPGAHEDFIKPLWKQGVGSTVHCIAGDATGIVLAAAITASLGLPMWLDLIVEYVTGFLFGLFIFQALFMKNMMGGTYLKALRRSFMPEWLSMNMMMAGMAPVMIWLMMGRDMRAMEPTQPVFWLSMAIGVVAGFFVAYPVNVWMVSREMKHGLMTVRPKAHDAHNEEAAHAGHAMADKGKHHSGMVAMVTRPQLTAVAIVTVLALLAPPLLLSTRVNLGLSARDVGGTFMPPGMVMSRDTPAGAMRDMSAADPNEVRLRRPPSARGASVLKPRDDAGTKVFDLEASVISWYILPTVRTTAYALNGEVPGPTLQMTEGDHVRINLTNHLPETTALHWHGLRVPNAMDGASYITQPPVRPGETFVYEFTVNQAGTFLYHSHDDSDRQQGLGLYGALLIDAARPVRAEYDRAYTVQLQEWLVREGVTYPSMFMEGALPNFFTINGKSYPATETVHLRVGERLLVRFVGTNTNFIHPMHIHGGPFRVVARDGSPVQPSAQFDADTVNVGPGQRYDVIWTADAPGKWLLHCHIAHHMKNNNVEEKGGGGLMMVLDVR